jgi:hypothetical protein
VHARETGHVGSYMLDGNISSFRIAGTVGR